MSEVRARPDANQCFVCGPDNPLGLRLRFRLDGEVCRASFTAGPHHGGWQELTHGGILYSVLDDVMANWLFLKGIRGHTAKCDIRYRQPVPIGTPLELEGRLVARRGRMAVLSGVARRAEDQAIVAETTGTFMIVDEGTSTRG
jgi:acyl-coenzyme A thioesterase PaaI-like protein